MHRNPQSWDNAKTVCAEEGGYLVTIIVEAENALMQLATAEDDLPVWTGGRDVNVRGSITLEVPGELHIYLLKILTIQQNISVIPEI